MRNKLGPVIVLIAMLVAACGGGSEGSETTAGDGAAVDTTVAGTDTTTADGTDTTSQPSGSTEEAGESGPIKFGMLIGVTGDYSPYYDVSKAGADVAIAEINEAGGVLGREVELVVVDNKSTVEGA